MVVRYMGTKRHMAAHVRDVIQEVRPQGRVVDLFSGMGSVAESLQSIASVVTNDALSFTAAISRARFTGPRRVTTPSQVVERLREPYERQIKVLETLHEAQLAEEDKALAGSREDLRRYMDKALHVANSPHIRRSARSAAEAVTSEHYQLASLYFSAGYLSLRQAIQVDALRAAIDADDRECERDWLLGSWIAGTSVLTNAPGHTAQFLRPNTEVFSTD